MLTETDRQIDREIDREKDREIETGRCPEDVLGKP